VDWLKHWTVNLLVRVQLPLIPVFMAQLTFPGLFINLFVLHCRSCPCGCLFGNLFDRWPIIVRHLGGKDYFCGLYISRRTQPCCTWSSQSVNQYRRWIDIDMPVLWKPKRWLPLSAESSPAPMRRRMLSIRLCWQGYVFRRHRFYVSRVSLLSEPGSDKNVWFNKAGYNKRGLVMVSVHRQSMVEYRIESSYWGLAPVLGSSLY